LDRQRGGSQFALVGGNFKSSKMLCIERLIPYLQEGARKLMYHTKIKRVVLLVLLTVTGLALLPTSIAKASDEPDLPPQCGSIVAPAGNRVAFHVYARGVQIYKWNGASWVFEEPRATLFAEANFFGEVGTHYRGPNWESKSGSKVGGIRVPGTGCRPDSSAIEWLILQSVSPTGPGIFHRVTYIQRVNTTGGLAPTTPGSSIDELREVPYTAEYYFYRAQD
jgi:Protein of unknown function (DUF3455)